MLRITCEEGCNGDITFYRTSGEMVCKICNDTYYNHPYCKQSEYESGLMYPYYSLHVLCNGEHVKL